MDEKNKKNISISFQINILIVILTVSALIMSFAGFKFMQSYDPSSELTQAPLINYFTVQFNTFMGIVSFVFAIREYQILKGIKKSIPLVYRILKMIATAAEGLIFFVIFALFGFTVKGGVLSLLWNNNLFFHFIIPIVSIINYIFFEKTDTIKFKYTFYCLLPTALYEVYYVINIITNMKDGKVAPIHDWYYFLQNGIGTAIIIAPMMLFITYSIALIIWKLNKLNYKK